jgi:hypothetical protein
MKETPRKRITVRSSLTEISTDQLRNQGVDEWGIIQPAPNSFYSKLLGRYLKTP